MQPRLRLLLLLLRIKAVKISGTKRKIGTGNKSGIRKLRKVRGFGSAEEIKPVVYLPRVAECIAQAEIKNVGFDQIQQNRKVCAGK